MVSELEDGEAIQKILRTFVGDGIDPEAPIDADESPSLEGGLALFSPARGWLLR
ncbi:MAG: hypothetical protein ACLQGP_37480 [Isosphaeraceae bacterium]